MNILSNAVIVFGGATSIALCSVMTALDGYQAITDKQHRAFHIAAFALDIFMILGNSLMIAGVTHSNLPLIFTGFSVLAGSLIIRYVVFKRITLQTHQV